MKLLRRMLVGLCAVVFFFSSVGLAWSHVLTHSLANRDTVKSWLSDGKFYDNITDVVLGSLATVDSKEAGEIPVEDPALQAAVKKVFTPQFLQTSSESVLDGVYNWLEGKADEPDFRIDLTQIRTQLASSLGDYAVERAADLPTCKTVPEDFDALSAGCLPRGVSNKDLKKMVENNLLKESSFIDEPIITADTLKGEDKKTNVFQNTEEIRKVYNGSKNLPIVFGVLTVLAAAGIVLASNSRRSGFLRLGILSTITAVILGLGYLALDQGPKAFTPDVLNDQGAHNLAAQELLTGMFESFASENKKLISLYAVAFALIAVACYVAYTTLGRNSSDENEEAEPKEPKPPADDSPKNEPVAKTSEDIDKPKKSPKQPPKIQL